MLAAIQTEPAGTPQLADMAEPTPRDGEMLIHVTTAGLGGWDISGAYQATMRYPCVVRGEGVGYTEDGRRVYFGEHARLPYGAFCERTVVPTAEAWDIPDDIDDELAIALGIAGGGAYGPLKLAAGLKPGDSVLITGATGAVGQLGLQIARHLGAGRVVAAGRDGKRLEELVERGIADGCAVIGSADDTDSLRSASGGDGYDVVLDVLYGHHFTDLVRATKAGARIITVGAVAGPQSLVAARDLIYRWHASWSTGRASVDDRRRLWLELLELGRKGIDVNYVPFAFEDVAQAYEAQRSSPHGKVVVSIKAGDPRR